jgi:hypothetical protein
MDDLLYSAFSPIAFFVALTAYCVFVGALLFTHTTNRGYSSVVVVAQNALDF